MKRLTSSLLTIVLLILMFPVKSVTEDSDNYEIKQIKKNLPKLLGANNVGKEFWFTIPPCYEESSGNNFVKIFVTAPTLTQVTVEVPGKGFFRTKKTIPNDVIEFNISPVVGQVYQRLQTSPYTPEKLYKGAGIHIMADDPLVVYCVVRYRATSDGFLAIPVSSWGKEYIAASYGDMGAMYSPWTFPSLVGITAGYDNTTVKFTLGGNEITQTAGGLKPGQTATKVMGVGDVWMFSSGGYEQDLTGSKIVSSKPIGIVSGNFCTNIPTTNRWCDYTVEMDLPTFTWGLHYNVPKIPKRVYPSLIRIFAKEPATKLYRDGAAVGNIVTSGGVLGKGYLEMRLVPMGESPASAVISGDKPIGVTLYNPGIQEDQQAGANNANSDPFVMAITPMEQYQREITFCTPAVYGGDPFAENYLNLVYETDEYGMMPDNVEFATVSSGDFVWQQLRTKYPGADEVFKVRIDGRQYAVKTITLPSDGVFKIRAKLPFAAYSFGYDSYDSYGYPTSAALMDLEKPDTVAPDPKYTSICGDVEIATVTDMPDDPEIRSNLAMIVFHSEESFNYIFDYDEFVPGESRETKWRLMVENKDEDAKAVITFTDRRGNDTTIIIEYFANKLDIEPKLIEFGRLKKGTEMILPFKVINRSETYEGEVNELRLKNRNQNFYLYDLAMDPISLPFHIMPLQEFEFNVKFIAVAEGTYIDSIGVGDSCKFEYIAEVTASVGEPVIVVDDHDYGSVSVGQSQPYTFTILNDGTTDLEITGYKNNTLSVFTHNLENFGMSPTTPLIIKPKQKKTFDVTFKPAASIEYIDSIVFENNAGANRDNVCDIRGLGIQPGLSANGFDWGRVRIDRPAHQIPPYDTRKGGAQPTAIVVENTGTEEVRVESINILELNPGDQKHFILPNGLKTGFSLQPGETRLYEAFCQPAETGEHQITITYNNTANSQAKSILKCIGILPKLETQDVDFGTTLVKTSPVDKEKIKVTKRVAFKNLNYEWEDSVTITNLQTFPNPGDISNVINIFGIEGFRYDKGAITFPIKLAPGESIEFQSEFAAMKNGDASASLVTVSDAEAEVESKWTGFGITKSITGTGGNVTTCVGVPAMINCEVENTGSDDLVISSVYFDPPVSSMNLDKPSDAQGFTLPPGEKRTISIDYLPLDEEDITTELFFGNDSEDSLFSVNVSGSTVYFRRTTLMNPNEQFVSIGGRAKVDIVLNNEEGNDMTKADVQRLDLVVTYNRAFLGTDPDKIVPGSAVQNGFTIEDLKIDQDNGVILFSLVSDGNAILNQEGVLARITFDAYLPVTNETESVVKTTISAPGNTCIEIDSSSSRIILNRICVLNLRLVNNLYRNYELGMIRPNPAGSEGANLSFSVAMDGWVNIRIIDVTGQLAATLVSDILKMGEYEIPLPVENISSGVYQVEMRSGDFRQTRSLIICK